MATCNYIREKTQNKTAMRKVIRYVSQDAKTLDENGCQYLSGVNCIGKLAYEEFIATKNLFGKMSGIFFFHYVQSFAPGEMISYDETHEIGIEVAKEMFPGYEVLVATHLDAMSDGLQRLNNHFVLNSVSYEQGRKWHTGPYSIEQIRKISDDICRKHHLSVLPEYRQTFDEAPIGAREYRVAKNGNSWKFQCIVDIEESMKLAGSKEDFIAIMESAGYAITWEDARKHITFTCPNGKAVRDKKLHESKFLKENMEYEFAIRQAVISRKLDLVEAEGGYDVIHPSNGGDTVPAYRIRNTAEGFQCDHRFYECNGIFFAGDVQNHSGSGNSDSYAGANVRGAGRFGGESGGFEAECRETDGLYRDGCTTSFGEQRGENITGWEDTRAFFFSTKCGNQYTNSYTFGYDFQNEEMDNSFGDRNGYFQRSAHCVGLPSFDEIVPLSTDTEEHPEDAYENRSDIQLPRQAAAQPFLNQQGSKKKRKQDYEYTL